MKRPKNNLVLIPDYDTDKWGYRTIYVLRPPYNFNKAHKLFVKADGTITWKGKPARREFDVEYTRGRIKKETKKKIQIRFDIFQIRFTYNRLVLCAWDETFNIYNKTMLVKSDKNHPYGHHIRYLTWEINKTKEKALGDMQVKAIRWLYKNKNTSYSLLAEAYGVSRGTIQNVIKRRGCYDR